MTLSCTDPRKIEQARDYVLGVLASADGTLFEDHVAGCAECARRVLGCASGLNRLADDVSVAFLSSTAPPAEGTLRVPWSLAALSRHVLSPAAAIAYLLLLSTVLPASFLLNRGLVRNGAGEARGSRVDPRLESKDREPGTPGAPAPTGGRGAEGPPPAALLPLSRPGGPEGTYGPAESVVARVLPPAIRVFGEETTRGGPGVAGGTGAAPEPSTHPLELVATARNEEEIVLDLRAEIADEDLEDPAAAFRVELWEGDRLIWSVKKRGSEFERGGALQIALATGRLARGALQTLAIRLEKPGDPFDGTILFRKSFRLNHRQSPAATKPAHK